MKAGIRHKIEFYLYSHVRHTRELAAVDLTVEESEWAHLISKWLRQQGIRISEKTLKAEIDPYQPAPTKYGLAIAEKYINISNTHDSILPIFETDVEFYSFINKALTDIAITGAAAGLIYP